MYDTCMYDVFASTPTIIREQEKRGMSTNHTLILKGTFMKEYIVISLALG